jgi:hypothetical protein
MLDVAGRRDRGRDDFTAEGANPDARAAPEPQRSAGIGGVARSAG